MEVQELKPIIEAVIFASDSAVTFDRIAGVLEGEERAEIRSALKELIEDYRSGDRGFVIEEVAGGYRFVTRTEHAPWIRRLYKIGAQRISKAAMEALAIVAYKQPVTRGEVEAIRGVDSGGVLATLLDKRFVKIVGRKELPGRPVVYGTTKEFLETFDLKDLSCLPSLKDIQSLEDESLEEDDEGQQTTERAGEERETGEAAEDNGPGGDRVQEEGRGDDPGGQGHGEREGGKEAGGQG